jgi:uncharacterized protein (TIGR02147 family)
MSMETVFAYMDYRQYLLDFFQEKKRLNTKYSLSLLADRAGFKARDYLLRVMQGKRNLSSEGIDKLSKLFALSEKQSEYFSALVLFNQANNIMEKEKYFTQLSEFQKYGRHQQLRQDQFEYLSSWHPSAIRSLLSLGNYGDDFERMGKLLDPPLTAKQIRDSIELLLRLGLIQKNSKGNYSVTQMALSTGDEVASLSVANFHKSTMELAKQSIDKHPSSSRDISGVTMSISQTGYRRIKSELQAFRKKIMAIATADKDEDMIYQLNLHLFPLTRNRGQ